MKSSFERKALTAAITTSIIASFAAPVMAQDDVDDTMTMEEVVVTATRRETTMTEIPYSISAVSGDFIDKARIITTGELLQGVPGASTIDFGARNAGTVNAIRIRGLAVDSNVNMDVRLSADPPVSTYLNETPLFAPMILKDLERVEVLRGPQGTLYGSGSLGGTVRYLTRLPVLGEFEGRVEASFSQTDGSSGNNWDGDAVINIPIGDTFAVRALVGKIDYAGIVDGPNLYVLDDQDLPIAPDGVLADTAVYESVRDLDTVDIDYARVSAFWQPTDTFDALLWYAYQEDDIGGRMQPTEGVDGWGDQYGKYEIGSIQREPSERKVDATALELNIDFGFATLTSSSSYYDHSGNSVSENTGFYAQNGWLANFYYNYPRPMASAERSFTDEAFIQELRLVSQGDTDFPWIVGVFYRDQEATSIQNSFVRGFKRWGDAFFGPGVVVSDSDFRYQRDENFEDMAIFGELTWRVTDSFSLTGGFRNFDNDYDNNTMLGVGLYSSFSIDDTASFQGSEDDTLWKFNAAWNFDEDKLLYANFAQGFRRGGANAVPLDGVFAEDPAWQIYDPDTTNSYEIGLKGGGSGSFWSVAAFYIDWQDIQLNTATTNWGFFAAQNGGDAHTQGIEVEWDVYFGENWHANLGYAFTQGELDETFLSPDGAFVAGTAGSDLPGVAENMINAMIENTLTLNNGWDWNNRLIGYYQSSTTNILNEDSVIYAEFPGFALFNFNSTVFIGDQWSVGLFVKNLTNERGRVGEFTEAWMGTDPAQNYFGSGAKTVITRPRTIGVAVTYDF